MGLSHVHTPCGGCARVLPRGVGGRGGVLKQWLGLQMTPRMIDLFFHVPCKSNHRLGSRCGSFKSRATWIHFQRAVHTILKLQRRSSSSENWYELWSRMGTGHRILHLLPDLAPCSIQRANADPASYPDLCPYPTGTI